MKQFWKALGAVAAIAWVCGCAWLIAETVRLQNSSEVHRQELSKNLDKLLANTAAPALSAPSPQTSGVYRLNGDVFTAAPVLESSALTIAPAGRTIFSIHKSKTTGKWVIDVPKDVKLEGAAEQFIKVLSLKLNEGCGQEKRQ